MFDYYTLLRNININVMFSLDITRLHVILDYSFLYRHNRLNYIQPSLSLL